jgi:hypothetical protein
MVAFHPKYSNTVSNANFSLSPLQENNMARSECRLAHLFVERQFSKKIEKFIHSAIHFSKTIFKKGVRKHNSSYGEKKHNAPHAQIGILPV